MPPGTSAHSAFSGDDPAGGSGLPGVSARQCYLLGVMLWLSYLALLPAMGDLEQHQCLIVSEADDGIAAGRIHPAIKADTGTIRTCSDEVCQSGVTCQLSWSLRARPVSGLGVRHTRQQLQQAASERCRSRNRGLLRSPADRQAQVSRSGCVSDRPAAPLCR
jgi:hypothetical protein